MSLCINPSCASATGEVNQGQSLSCSGCESPLLILDIYRVLKKLGEGGFGKTYLISDSGSQYVLKVLHNQTPKAIELFQQEAEVLKKLNHPGIPRFLHPSPFIYRPQGSSPPLHCLIMEYIEGESLYDYLEKRKFQPISEVAALRWLRQLVEIIHVVHGANYFHRDIKPNNIMLKTDGKLVLIDFGTAREKTPTYFQKQQRQKITGIISVGYTPFEQQQGSAEPRSDFFALGRTFVFLLTGQNPGNFQDSITQGLQWQSYAQGYAKPLRDFIDKLMQHDVNQRPANTAELLRQIESLEKQLQPQSYGTPTPVKTTQISAPPLMGPSVKTTQIYAPPLMEQLGEITDKITRSLVWSLVWVFSALISGIWKLICNILSFIFGGAVHFLNGVWLLLQFIVSLIFSAFIGYLLSPVNREFPMLVFLMLAGYFGLFMRARSKNIFLIVVYSLVSFVCLGIASLVSVLSLGLILEKFQTSYNLVYILIYACACVGIIYPSDKLKECSFGTMVLRLITVALGLGIGWMIYQHFPIVESPPPLR